MNHRDNVILSTRRNTGDVNLYSGHSSILSLLNKESWTAVKSILFLCLHQLDFNINCLLRFSQFKANLAVCYFNFMIERVVCPVVLSYIVCHIRLFRLSFQYNIHTFLGFEFKGAGFISSYSFPHSTEVFYVRVSIKSFSLEGTYLFRRRLEIVVLLFKPQLNY